MYRNSFRCRVTPNNRFTLRVQQLCRYGAHGDDAALIYFLQNHADTVARWLNHLPALSLDPQKPGIPSVVFGIVLIAVMVLLPTGVGGLVRRLFGPLTTRLYTRS